MIDISVIIVNWNTKKLTVECIESIYSYQEKLNLEIIVVDNDSSDDSVAVLRRKFPKIKLVENEQNLGFAKANNIGIKMSRGKYLALINSDIKIINPALPLLFKFMESEENIGISGPAVFNQDMTYQCSCRKMPTIWNNLIEATGIHNYLKRTTLFSGEFYTFDKLKLSKDVEILSGCFWFIRRSALEKVGMLDENFFFYGEDKDFCVRFRMGGYRVTYLPTAKVIHYGGASSSLSPAKFNKHLLQAQTQFNRKYFSSYKFLSLFLIYLLTHSIRFFLFSILYTFLNKNKKELASQKIRVSYQSVLWLVQNSYS